LKETYSKARIGKNLSDAFSVKNVLKRREIILKGFVVVVSFSSRLLWNTSRLLPLQLQ